MLRIELGFTVLNVTVTSHRVLSLIASLIISFVFAFGPLLIETFLPKPDTLLSVECLAANASATL